MQLGKPSARSTSIYLLRTTTLAASGLIPPEPCADGRIRPLEFFFFWNSTTYPHMNILPQAIASCVCHKHHCLRFSMS